MASAPTSIDLDALKRGLELCRAATRTAGDQWATAGEESEKDIPSGKSDDAEGASSDEEWTLPITDKTVPDKPRKTDTTDRSLSPSKRSQELRILADIKQLVENLGQQVMALKKETQRSNDARASSSKDNELEKALLSSMFPTTECKHDKKIWYGNGSGHGLKCAQCGIKVFHHRKGDMSIKVPPS